MTGKGETNLLCTFDTQFQQIRQLDIAAQERPLTDRQLGEMEQNQYKSSISELISLWSIQESLLQQYRAMFITIQSIFIAVSAAILGMSDSWAPLLFLTILGLITLYLWVTICNVRGETVYFIQSLILRAENGEDVHNPLEKIKHMQSVKFESDKRNPFFLSLRGGTTRWKMERLLPSIFLLTWIFLWIIWCIQHFDL